MVLLRNIIAPLAVAAVTAEAFPINLNFHAPSLDLRKLGGGSRGGSLGGGKKPAPAPAPPAPAKAPPAKAPPAPSKAAPPAPSKAAPSKAAPPPSKSAAPAASKSADTKSVASSAAKVSSSVKASASSAVSSAASSSVKASVSSAASSAVSSAVSSVASSVVSGSASTVATATTQTTGGPPPPTDAPTQPLQNPEAVPGQVTCKSKAGDNTHNSAQIQAAIKRGLQYFNAKTVATKGSYPHVFSNDPDNIVFNGACTGPLQEFPILKDHSTINVGKSNKGLDVGTDRVVFTVDAQAKPLFCGVMTHNSPTFVKNKAGKNVLPFAICQ